MPCYYFRPVHEYHRDYSSEVGCSADPSNNDIKDTMDCLQSKPLKELYEKGFMFDECNLLTTGFGGYGNNIYFWFSAILTF